LRFNIALRLRSSSNIAFPGSRNAADSKKTRLVTIFGKRYMSKDLPWILGLSASHNGAACLLRGSEIFVAVQEERLTRVKRQWIYGAAHSLAAHYCLSFAGIQPHNLSAIALSVTGSARDPQHNLQLNPLVASSRNRTRTFVVPHHYAHAVSAFATSGFADSAILVIDGVGSPAEDMFEEERKVFTKRVEYGSEMISLYSASGMSLVPLEKYPVEYGAWLTKRSTGMPLFASLGGMYSAVAEQIFGNAMEAGKVMGLAPLGFPEIPVDAFFEIKKGNFHFRDLLPGRFAHNHRWPLHEDEYKNLAASVQVALEEALSYLIGRLRTLQSSRNLCYAGGVALNSVANEQIIRRSGFQEVHIMPAAEDSGAAIGAAYYALWQLTGENSQRTMVHDACGQPYSTAAISGAVRHATGVRAVPSTDPISDAVELLCEGKIIGWFDGRSEIGPRALGQRSILCDPRRISHKDMLNRKVKKRESFRPFAPAILREEVANWFELDGVHGDSPFMLRVCNFRRETRELVPAVVHVDGTGRLQTLTKEANGNFYALVRRFYQKTGVPIILNTSFNIAGYPIVETPADAIACLLATELDCCVFEDQIVCKYVNW
jgi:carbamoyltransferase